MKPVPLLLAAIVASLSLSACVTNDYGHRDSRPGYSKRYKNDRHQRERHKSHKKRHKEHHKDRRKAERRHMKDSDVIYRDRNGRYYCKRDDGTTGTIVGAIGGGVLGNIIAPGGSKTLGTILGAGAGALAGRAIDRGDIRCE